MPPRAPGTGRSPSPAGFSKAVPLHSAAACAVRTPRRTRRGLGSSGSARRYSRNRCFFLFLRLLRCFSSPGSPPCVMDWRMDAWGASPCGFPHSDTCGSPGICPSPQLFAACRVFHRLLVPRHPPCALPCLTSLLLRGASAPLLPAAYSVMPGSHAWLSHAPHCLSWIISMS